VVIVVGVVGGRLGDGMWFGGAEKGKLGGHSVLQASAAGCAGRQGVQ